MSQNKHSPGFEKLDKTKRKNFSKPKNWSFKIVHDYSVRHKKRVVPEKYAVF
jgi:hypothetical protein